MLNYLNNFVVWVVSFASEKMSVFWQHIELLNFGVYQVLIDLAFVSILFYFLFILLKGTRALHILSGLMILAAIYFLGQWLNLVALNWILDRFLTVTLFAIPVIFQQELRMGLEKLGKTKIFQNQAIDSVEANIQEILASCDYMLTHKIGALIVMKSEVGLEDYAETGIEMRAKISQELLKSIFIPQSPLHDGAVIIDGDRIKAAACILPPSFKNYGHDYGTRHKAALGLSEMTDAQIIVVSEEKRSLSYVREGKIEKNIDLERLSKLLKNFYKSKKKSK